MELGSNDQAKDLVKYHINYPPTVNGQLIEFSISNTFSFLQVHIYVHKQTWQKYLKNSKWPEMTPFLSLSFNSQSSNVVSFIPSPADEHGKSDLLSIVKRFGTPFYTLFLPSRVSHSQSNSLILVMCYTDCGVRGEISVTLNTSCFTLFCLCFRHLSRWKMLLKPRSWWIIILLTLWGSTTTSSKFPSQKNIKPSREQDTNVTVVSVFLD